LGLVRVNDLRLKFDDGAAGLLYTNNISYFRKFSGRGIAFWEQNTLLNKSSALQFINVRILCNIIKRAAYDFLLYGLQEPNDDILRKQLEFGLNEYLITVKAGRGISNYRIVIDDSNNPAALVNSGVLAVAVIITPILAVREIQLTLALSKQGMEVSEAEISSF
jgi:phage tail sheath protein FI